MNALLRSFLGPLLLLWISAAAAQTAPTGPDWRYTVRPGDELWGIAARFCGSSSYAQRLAAHNALTRPEALRAGTALRIPVAWLVRQPAAVLVRAVSGTAQDGAGQPLAIGDRIAMGARIRTGDGFAVVAFADGSTLEIGPRSDVLFNILTAFGDTGMVDTHLRFYRGRGAARVVKRATGSRFRIWTPSGIAAVRGTDFRVGTLAQPSVGSRVETLTGAVEFSTANATVPLPAGFGVLASPEGVTRESLLPAPTFVTAAQAVLGPTDVVQWQSVSDAARYSITLYAQGTTQDVPVAAAETIDPQYGLSALPVGVYGVTVRAVSANGLEGYGTTQAVQRVAAPPPVADLGATVGLFDRGRGDASVTLEWTPGPVEPTLELVPLDSVTAAQPLSVPAGASTLSLRAPPGRYRVKAEHRVAGVTSSAATVEFEVQPPTPRWLPLLLLLPALFAL